MGFREGYVSESYRMRSNFTIHVVEGVVHSDGVHIVGGCEIHRDPVPYKMWIRGSISVQEVGL